LCVGEQLSDRWEYLCKQVKATGNPGKKWNVAEAHRIQEKIENYQHCNMIGAAEGCEARQTTSDKAYVEAQASLLNNEEHVIGLTPEGKRKLEAASDGAGSFKKTSSQTGFLKEVIAQGQQRQDDAATLLTANQFAADKLQDSVEKQNVANRAAAQTMHRETLSALSVMIKSLADKL